jgi:hypothetical protein
MPGPLAGDVAVDALAAGIEVGGDALLVCRAVLSAAPGVKGSSAASLRPTDAIAGAPPGGAANSSFARRASVAMSSGALGLDPTPPSLIGIGVVMVFADLDIVQYRYRVFGQYG